MASLFNLPLPFQRRLTKMYTDTKSSYDFVKEPVQSAEDPELLSLHRKLRIQKDRLVSWGLQWSDPTKSPDIDESIHKAGLGELVGSVMSTIKEILAEAEPLWQSSKRSVDEKGSLSEKPVDRKPSLIIWDKSRFEDLIRDLTMSIDTLYDLSRTRQSTRTHSGVKPGLLSTIQSKSPLIEERQFESTRMQTPQQIDPASIIWPQNLKGMQAGMFQPAKSPRQIVFMHRPISASIDARRAGLESLPIVPILLEHAPYNSIYSITGITPSLSRFERLFSALSQTYTSTDRLLSGLLRLIGYFEEPEHSRFCLLYALPGHFGPLDIQSPTMPAIIILSDLLSNNAYEPSLEIKYRLAHDVANAVFALHSKGVVHGSVISSNVLFVEHQSQKRLDLTQVNMRQSFLASFDLFSDNATDNSELSLDPISLYRHPLDPRTTRYTHLTSESKSLDLYGLALFLLEIGMWTSLTDIFSSKSTLPETPVEVFRQLATRCGSLYTKAVQACWNAPQNEISQLARPDIMHQKVLWKVSKALNACCAIDEVSDTENESDDSPPIPSSPIMGSPSFSSTKRMPRMPQMPTYPEHKMSPSSATESTKKQSDRSESPSHTHTTPLFAKNTGFPEKAFTTPSSA